MKNWIVCIGLFLVTTACQNQDVRDKESENTSASTDVITENSEPVEVSTQQIETVNFEQLQPYLNKKDEKVHIINFWATWCIPCVEELPFFESLNEKYEDVELTLISLDFPSKIEERLIPFVEENKLKGEVVLLDEPDGNIWIPKIDPAWSGAIPATVIYKGNKRKFYEQSFNFETLEEEVLTFM